MASIIPIFIPHVGCPHDCVFCNQKKIAGKDKAPEASTVAAMISDALENATLPAQIAFYGGSFTAIESSLMQEYLSAVSPFIEDGRVSGIRISTRPDCINEDVLQTLLKYNVDTIELGAQSLDESVLLKSGRGHTAEDTVRATALIKRFGFALILQMMTHLPGSDDEKDLLTARKIAALSPAGVRVYPTVVVRDTALEDLWRAGKYSPATPELVAKLGAQIIEIFEEKNIPIIRFGLNPTEDLSGGDALCGAYHPALGEMARAERFFALAKSDIEKKGLSGGKLTLFVHPKCVSTMSGVNKNNKKRLCELFGFSSISIRADSALPKNTVYAGKEN